MYISKPSYEICCHRWIDAFLQYLEETCLLHICLRALQQQQEPYVNPNTVMSFILLFQSPEDVNCILNTRFSHINRVKSSLESSIFLHIFPIFFGCSGSNATQLTSSQHWLQKLAASIGEPSLRPEIGRTEITYKKLHSCDSFTYFPSKMIIFLWSV